MLGHDYIEKSIINSALAWISHICCKSIIMDTVTPILLLFMATLLTPSWTTKTELDLGLDIQDILLTNLGLEQKIYFEWSKRGCEATELSFFERSEKKRSSMSEFFFDS